MLSTEVETNTSSSRRYSMDYRSANRRNSSLIVNSKIPTGGNTNWNYLKKSMTIKPSQQLCQRLESEEISGKTNIPEIHSQPNTEQPQARSGWILVSPTHLMKILAGSN